MTDTRLAAADFNTLLLGVLGHTDGEFTSLGYEDPSEVVTEEEFHTAVMTPADAPGIIGRLPSTANIFYGVNPVRGPVRRRCGRGKETDVTRLSAVWADLDVKTGACPSLDVARAIVANLSIILGTRPSAVVESGHGLHPYWPISDGHIVGGDITAARALVKRWGRLVAVVADKLGVTAVDNVYDLPRMMRVPGTLNNKISGNGAQPLPVTAYADTGGPLTMTEVDERLTEVGIVEEPDDTAADTDPVSKPDDWQFAWRTCDYVAAILAGLPTDTPPPPEKAKKGRGRHQWAASQAVKLNCALRLGCISETDCDQARDLLDKRLRELRAETGETVPRHEISGLFKLGQQRTACKTDEQCRAELGNHHCANRADGPEGKPPIYAEAILTRSALWSLPDPEPLIDNVIDQGTTTLLYGKWGSGKSFIVQDLAASVATGRAWQGRDTEQRRVLYIAAEGAHGLKNRLQAWETGWHTTICDGQLDILPQPVNLTRPLEAASLAALIAYNGYGFVIIDTLARCMVGADENSAKDCGLVVDVLHQLRQKTPGGRGVVLGVHHTGKDGKTFRGSSVFEAGADTVYSVTQDTDDGAIILNREKRKDGLILDIHRLKLDPINDTGSCVLSKSHLSETKSRADALLSHFKSHFADTGATAAQLRDTIELPRATFYRALNDLVKRGVLVNTGTDKRPFYKLAEK